MPVKMDKHERDLVERYGFQVTVDPDGHYRVVDPQMPRRNNTHVGGNLYALLLRAIDERGRAKLNIVEFTPAVEKSKANSPEGIVIQLPKLRHIKEGKIYTIKQILIDNQAATIEDIDKRLKELGLQCARSTISSVRMDFLDTMRILKLYRLIREDK